MKHKFTFLFIKYGAFLQSSTIWFCIQFVVFAYMFSLKFWHIHCIQLFYHFIKSVSKISIYSLKKKNLFISRNMIMCKIKSFYTPRTRRATFIFRLRWSGKLLKLNSHTTVRFQVRIRIMTSYLTILTLSVDFTK